MSFPATAKNTTSCHDNTLSNVCSASICLSCCCEFRSWALKQVPILLLLAREGSYVAYKWLIGKVSAAWFAHLVRTLISLDWCCDLSLPLPLFPSLPLSLPPSLPPSLSLSLSPLCLLFPPHFFVNTFTDSYKLSFLYSAEPLKLIGCH